MKGECEHHLYPHGGGLPKRRYHSRSQAEAAARTIKRRGEKRPRTPQRAYCCPGCGSWFLTANPQ